MKTIFLFSIIIGLVAMIVTRSNSSKQSNVTLTNFLSIATTQAEGHGATGPAVYKDCSDSSMTYTVICMCENNNPCDI